MSDRSPPPGEAAPSATGPVEGMASAIKEVAPEMALPTSILPLPSSLASSLSSWWNLSGHQTAEAELYLFGKSGYFPGATLGNARACAVQGPDALAKAYQLVQDPNQVLAKAHSKDNQFFTVGTSLAANGKVACVRMEDIGEAPKGTIRSSALKSLGFGGAKRLINTLEIGTAVPFDEQPKDEAKIVLVHGYAAGSAFFFKNLGMFGDVPNSRLFAIDWLGMGRSSRPPYSLPRSGARTKERVEAAESYFLSSLEQWREKMKIEKMVLVGHSLGGYLSTAYSLKYPERVERLILVSPVGIPEGSWDLHGDQNERLKAEEQRKKQTTDTRLNRSDSNSSASSVTSDSRSSPPPPRPFSARSLQVLGWLWDHNVSIFGIVRSVSVFGPLLISGYTRNRFGAISNDELLSMHAYCHVADILAPGAYARNPLIHRMSPLKMPVYFLYVRHFYSPQGDRDWMDVNGGIDAKRLLAREGNTNSRVFMVPKAGHHLYLDNAKEFNKVMSRLLRK